MGKYAIAVKIALAVATLAAMGLFGLRHAGDARGATQGAAWPKIGQWHVAKPEAQSPSDETSRLLSLGYVEASKPAPAGSGVTVNVADRVAPGVNLYVSGHASEAYLIDAAGSLLQTWKLDRGKAFPQLTGFAAKLDVDRLYWRWARPRPDGSLVAVFEGAGLVAVDHASNLLWAHQGFNHHDFDLGPDDRIYALGRKRRVVPAIRPEPIIDDRLQVLDHDGKLLREISILDALPPELLQRIPRTPVRATDGSAGDDVLHTNAVRYLDGAHTELWPQFTRGRVLISIRELDALAVIDLESAKVVWHLTDAFRKQHSPEIQDDGRILIFDNQGAGSRSRILELRPGRPPTLLFDGGDKPFFSKTCGTVQRLSNGNLLIAVSEAGRAIEATPRGEIVWEFWNPHRAGKDGELIAALFEMQRLPAAMAR